MKRQHGEIKKKIGEYGNKANTLTAVEEKQN